MYCALAGGLAVPLTAVLPVAPALTVAEWKAQLLLKFAEAIAASQIIPFRIIG